MSFTATCPACGAVQRRANEVRGRTVSCPDCGEKYAARPTRPKSPDNTVTYLIVGALALLLVGAGVLLFVLVLRKSPEGQVAAASAPVAPTTLATPVPVAVKPDPAPQPTPTVKPVALTSDAFRQQFARDADAAERQYKNQTLEITGTISSLQDLAPIRGVIIGTLQDPAPPVLFDLAADQAAVFAKLKPGQKVTIRGVFQNKTAEGLLGLSKCQVVTK